MEVHTSYSCMLFTQSSPLSGRAGTFEEAASAALIIKTLLLTCMQLHHTSCIHAAIVYINAYTCIANCYNNCTISNCHVVMYASDVHCISVAVMLPSTNYFPSLHCIGVVACIKRGLLIMSAYNSRSIIL